MTEAPAVAIRYLGLEVHPSATLEQMSPRMAFVSIDKPMPVGTELELIWQDHRAVAHVVRVHETIAGAEQPSGMRIVRGELDAKFAEMWDSLASGDDPIIPEPAPGGVEAVVSGDDTEVVEQPEKGSDRRTDIMSAVDIAGIEAQSESSALPPADSEGDSDDNKPRRRRARGKKKR